MTELVTLGELQIRYGKAERVDSATGFILVNLGLSAEIPSRTIAMAHRYQSLEAFEAYKTANLVQYEIANPKKWIVTYHGPLMMYTMTYTGVYGVIFITPCIEHTKESGK